MAQEKVQYGTISIVSIAHMINDTYSNFLPQFLPFLLTVTGFGYAKATFLLSVFTLSSSIIQPMLGFMIDRQNRGWLLYIGTLWMTIFLSLMGLTTNYWYLVMLSLIAGMGTAAFHPQASSLMGEISGSKKGFMMSAFMATGNLGYALSPLLFIPMLNYTGLKGTVYLLIPGVIASALLIKFVKVPVKAPHKSGSENENTLLVLRNAGPELSKLIVVIVLRSTSYMGLIALLPSYFKTEKISILTSGNLMFLMLFAGVLGGIFGGWISDFVGRKYVTVFSLLLSTLAFFGFFYTKSSISYILLALGGALRMGSFSVTVVAAQEIIPRNRGMASGISIGFSVGLGGMAVTLVGWFADMFGLGLAIQLLFILNSRQIITMLQIYQ